MKHLAVILFLLPFFVSCSHSPKDRIDLFNGVSFHLEPREHVAEIKTADFDLYSSFFESSSIQSPLFRRIEGPGYTIFVGLPISTTWDDLKDQRPKEVPSNHTMNGDSDEILHLSYEHTAGYIDELTKLAGNNLVHLLAIRSNDGVADTLFTTEALKSRFQSKT